MALPDEQFIPLPEQRVDVYLGAFKDAVAKGLHLDVEFTWRVKASPEGIIPASRIYQGVGKLVGIEEDEDQVLFSFNGASKWNPFPCAAIEYHAIVVHAPEATMPERKRDRDDVPCLREPLAAARPPATAVPSVASLIATCHLLPERTMTETDKADFQRTNTAKFQVVLHLKVPQIRSQDFAVLDVFCFARLALEGLVEGHELAALWKAALMELRVKKFFNKLSVHTTQTLETHSSSIEEFLKELQPHMEISLAKWKAVYREAVGVAAVAAVAMTNNGREMSAVTLEGNRQLDHGYIDLAGIMESRSTSTIQDDPKNGAQWGRGRGRQRGQSAPQQQTSGPVGPFRGRGRGRGA